MLLCCSGNLQPLLQFEDQQYNQCEYDHQSDGERVTERPLQLGHNLEVHAVHTGNQCWWQEENIHHGEDLDDLVLLDVYQTEERILEVVQTVESEARVFKQ